MISMEKRIIKTAESLFNRYGIRSITMDEVCREMRISKKTLYEHVENKRSLVKALLESIFGREENVIARIEAKEVSSIDKLELIIKTVGKKLQNKHPAFYFDIEKYYPGLFEELRRQRSHHIIRVIKKIIAAGIEEGLFRKNVDAELEALLFHFQMRGYFVEGPGVPDGYSAPEILSAIFMSFVRGLANEKGLEYLEAHFMSVDNHMNKE